MIENLIKFVTMKKLVVFFFLFGYLFSSTELSELLKIDSLLEHYEEHKGESSKISFSNFLYMHYVDHGQDNGDGEKETGIKGDQGGLQLGLSLEQVGGQQ